MQEKFKNKITEHFAFLKEKKLLLAVSGGLDSMVMLDIFRKLSFDIAIAHCNFQLRANESNKDQEFVENYA